MEWHPWRVARTRIQVIEANSINEGKRNEFELARNSSYASYPSSTMTDSRDKWGQI